MPPSKLIVLALVLLAGAIQGQVVVTGGHGWYRRDNNKSLLLARGNKLSNDEPINGSSESGDLILDCGPQGWLLYSCSGDSCTAHVCKIENSSVLKVKRTFLAHVTQFALLRHEPVEAAAVAAVRASGGPSDAVVLQTPQGVHWGPALARVLRGQYCFRLTHLPASGAYAFTIAWNPRQEKEGIADVPNLVPGLYRFEQGTPADNGGCRADTDATPAWVLVTPQARFAAIDKQWEEDSAKIDDLEQGGLSTSALSTLRHGVLATLADTVEGR